MSGRRSKQKGAAGEREAAAALNEVLGTHLHRGRQYSGGPNSPDIAGDLPELNIEVKRTERFNLYDALAQSEGDAGTGRVPVVLHRKNNKPWVLVVKVTDLIPLLDVVDKRRAKLEVVSAARDNSDQTVPADSGEAQQA